MTWQTIRHGYLHCWVVVEAYHSTPTSPHQSERCFHRPTPVYGIFDRDSV